MGPVPTLILHFVIQTNKYKTDHRLLVSFKVALLALLGAAMPLLLPPYGLPYLKHIPFLCELEVETTGH